MNMNLLLDMAVAMLLTGVAWVDAKTMKIPDRFQSALGVCGLLSALCVSDPPVEERIIGMVCVSVPMLLLCMRIPGAFGGGDVKLTFVMGWYLGWRRMMLGAWFGVIFGGMQATYLLVNRRARALGQTHMAFGPALCTGLILSMMWGESIVSWYLGLFY